MREFEANHTPNEFKASMSMRTEETDARGRPEMQVQGAINRLTETQWAFSRALAARDLETAAAALDARQAAIQILAGAVGASVDPELSERMRHAYLEGEQMLAAFSDLRQALCEELRSCGSASFLLHALDVVGLKDAAAAVDYSG